MHQSIAVDMLYKATLGSDSHRHPEWTSFTEGFTLPCRNGFRFTEVWVSSYSLHRKLHVICFPGPAII